MSEHWYKDGVLVAPSTKGAYPSVTTILDGAAKPGLEDVYRRMGFEEGDALINDARERGTAVHQAIEDYNRGVQPMELSEEEGPFYQGYHNWREAAAPIVKHAELYVESRKHRFAGTIDLLAEIDGQLWIIDTKTTSQHKKEHGMQLKAYQQAFYEMEVKRAKALDLGPKTVTRPRMAILKLTDKTQKGWQWREYNEPLKPFLGLLDWYKWTVRKRKAVVQKNAEEAWAPEDLLCKV